MNSLPPVPDAASRRAPKLRIAGHHGRRGVALLLVLSAMVLLSVLVIGILGLARQEVSSSAAYSAGNEARILADTALSLVTAQISEATKNPDEAWISQPGLLRTFTPQGQNRAYKLYSSYQMIVEGADFNPGAPATRQQEVPDNWAELPLEFVDLNRPVHFQNRWVYPVVDPHAVGLVEGFTIDNAEKPAAAAGIPAADALPMPVRWIYVTPDGQFVGANDPRRGEANARIAFWTDDESSKVNLNTAAGGVYYDAPAVNTRDDHMMGRTQPIAQEYQRWPGHPATTSLAPVLGPLREITDPAARTREASDFTPRIGWGGSEGGTKYAWLDRNLGTTDMDRLFASVDEAAFGRAVSDGERQAFEFSTGSLEDADQKLDQLRFFLTTQSRAPELNLFNRPRVTLWPFNQEMVQGNGDPSVITPEDRLIRFASELGGVTGTGILDYTKRKRFYFQRKSAWEPRADYDDIVDNQALYAYLQEMTSRPIPSASTARTGNVSFETKLGELNRDQVLTSAWDYIRSNVNTVNAAYEPVGFTPYSFPQGHDTQTTGFNDIAPLKITTNAGETKGLGRFPVLNEVICQFTSLGENLVTEGSETYVLRKVRLVLLLNFHMPVNSLMTSEPRFQIRITGPTPFDFYAQGTTGNPIGPKTQVVGMRNPVVGTDFSDSLGAAGLGFPATGSNGIFRDTCYVNSYWLSGGSEISGNMGISLAMFSSKVNKPRTGNTVAETDHHLKVLANRQALSGRDEDYFENSAWGGGTRQDIFYPFVSDVVEIRLPQKTDPGTGAPLTEPTPVNEDGKDFFQMLFSGGNLDIEIYPGLEADATALSPVNSNWQSQTPENRLYKTSINFTPTVIPVPRVGDGSLAVTGDKNIFGGEFPTFKALQDYYKRGECRESDFLMNVPRKSANNAPDTYQMDVFRSYCLTSAAPVNGDLRLAALRANDVPSSWWEKSALYDSTGTFHGAGYLPRAMSTATLKDAANGESNDLMLVPNDVPQTNPQEAARRGGRLHPNHARYGGLWGDHNTAYARTVPPTNKGTTRVGSDLGDFTMGYGSAQPGALVLGPDPGSITRGGDPSDPGAASPYFGSQVSRSGDNDVNAQTHFRNFMGVMFSPFKQAPSPVLFGTLPARSQGNSPSSWETLLFNPHPSGGRATHRGWNQTPRDHFLLDLFYMPVVEPYAITENFATAGKINMNYQIAPFTYIKRESGLHALLDVMTERWAPGQRPSYSVDKMAGSALLPVPLSAGDSSSFRSSNKKMTVTNSFPTTSYRKFLNIEETLRGFQARFENGANDPFVSASEICEIPMVPEGRTYANVDAFWNDESLTGLTGDDKREAPYNHLYPRVTTRSNTYRVHFWVQTLNPRRAGNTPRVTGEYRGSTIIERYLDPNITTYGDPLPATPASGGSYDADALYPPLSDKYRFRKMEHHQFAP